MKTIGELLKTARQKKALSLMEVADRTKIQEKFIRALEADNYHALPESAFVKGFIRNYALSLGEDPKMLLAVFRRDYSEDAKGKVVPRGLTDPLNQPRLRWTPKVTAVVSFAVIILVVTSYLILQFRLLAGGPNLTIHSPTANAIVGPQISIQGITHPQATLTIQNKQITVGDDGKFTETISLSQGPHTIIIEATDRSGHTTTIQRPVVVRE
ncbi:MAG: helix-turn-helix domain-containing protein [Candidatus Chisholmbacteria bacterium]|nr:helix-turn-helix domain-containing protein [Candidatus Chisholmbacteria bacterium]